MLSFLNLRAAACTLLLEPQAARILVHLMHAALLVRLDLAVKVEHLMGAAATTISARGEALLELLRRQVV